MNTTDRQHADPRHDPKRVVPTPADEALSVPREHREPAVEASTTPEAVRQAADGLSFARPLLVTAPQLADAGALVDLAARFSTVDAPVVAAPLADASGAPLLDRLGALL